MARASRQFTIVLPQTSFRVGTISNVRFTTSRNKAVDTVHKVLLGHVHRLMLQIDRARHAGLLQLDLHLLRAHSTALINDDPDALRDCETGGDTTDTRPLQYSSNSPALRHHWIQPVSSTTLEHDKPKPLRRACRVLQLEVRQRLDAEVTDVLGLAVMQHSLERPQQVQVRVVPRRNTVRFEFVVMSANSDKFFGTNRDESYISPLELHASEVFLGARTAARTFPTGFWCTQMQSNPCQYTVAYPQLHDVFEGLGH